MKQCCPSSLSPYGVTRPQWEKKDSSLYGKSALVNIRSGLNRHMTLPPWNRIIKVMHDAEFKVANQVLIGHFRKIEMDGNDKTQHKPAISAADMKMYHSDALDANNLVGLQHKVFIDIMLHFSRRGRRDSVNYGRIALFSGVMKMMRICHYWLSLAGEKSSRNIQTWMGEGSADVYIRWSPEMSSQVPAILSRQIV